MLSAFSSAVTYITLHRLGRARRQRPCGRLVLLPNGRFRSVRREMLEQERKLFDKHYDSPSTTTLPEVQDAEVFRVDMLLHPAAHQLETEGAGSISDRRSCAASGSGPCTRNAISHRIRPAITAQRGAHVNALRESCRPRPKPANPVRGLLVPRAAHGVGNCHQL